MQIGVWPPGATIRYTTDGSTPTATNGQLYRKPIAVTANMSIAAVAFRNGLADSNISVTSYLIGPAAAAAEIKSYHLGNSLTDTVDGYLQPIANSAGKNLFFMRKTIPGCAISMNWQTPGQGFGTPGAWAADYRVVLAKKVDHLFLQPFPNPPGLKADGEFGGKFIALARKHNSDVQVWLYAQWPAVDSWRHALRTVRGPVGCNRPGFRPTKSLLPGTRPWPTRWPISAISRRSGMQSPGKKPIRLCPGGPALVRIEEEIAAGKVPGMTDFRGEIFSDAIHLSRPGRYLVSLVHYACIYGENPQGKLTIANSGLNKEQAAIFQRIAWETVLAEPDSGVRPSAK